MRNDKKRTVSGNPLEPSSDADEVQQESLKGAANVTLGIGMLPDVFGEQSISGDMPDPESDDNMLDNMHQYGIALEADEDDSKELDVAGDVAAAERTRRGM